LGPPAFILVARVRTRRCCCRRDRASRAARAKPEDILGALTGGPSAPPTCRRSSRLRRPEPQAIDARQTWQRMGVDRFCSEAPRCISRQYVRAVARRPWQLRAARRAGWQIEYPSWSGNFPQSVRLQSTEPNVGVDLTAALSQIETNKTLEDAAFTVNVAPDAERLRSTN